MRESLMYGLVVHPIVERTNDLFHFRENIERLKNSLESLVILLEERKNLEINDHRRNGIEKLIEELGKGEKLVQMCSNVRSWNIYRKLLYSNKVVKLDEAILSFFQRDLQVETWPFNNELLRFVQRELKDMDGSIGEQGRTVVVSPVGKEGLYAVPELPDHRRTVLHDPNNVRSNYMLNVPVNLSPTSGFSSQWQKGKFIGGGTFGNVYVAINRETGVLCAMKEVNLIPDDPKYLECINQLEQEIEFLSELKHPNIVQYYGSEIFEDRFCIYMEYVHPGSINKYAREHYRGITQSVEHCIGIPESVVRNFTRHILQGLAYLHSAKIIHRDIKGANLLVDACGVVKLADFGMAKHLSGEMAELSLKGSPYWMAPEVINAVMQKDLICELAPAVDIWSLGCTIIEMLTGKPPWREFEGAAAMFMSLNQSPPIPETLSPEGKEFLECCFRRNPAERPSASMLLEHRFLRTLHHADFPAST